MKVAYIIGPYRAKTIHGIKKNIDNAEEVALSLWKRGFAVICPHKNTAFFDGEADDDVWLEGDKEILSRCDFAVALPDYKNSSGSIAEIEYCKKKGIPIYYYEDGEIPLLDDDIILGTSLYKRATKRNVAHIKVVE